MNINYDEIDELMRPIIKILNDNGITTKFCCQGHKDNELAYIMFDEKVGEEDLNFLLQLFDYFYLKCNNIPNEIPMINQFRLKKWNRFSTYKGELDYLSNWLWEVVNIKNKDREFIMGTILKRLENYFKK